MAQFFLFGLIAFNIFIFYGVSIFDEFLLFIVILKITYENYHFNAYITFWWANILRSI